MTNTTRTDAPTTIDLLRHGACEGGEIFRGVTDSALTPEGWQQMAAALAPHNGWQRVVSSPLQRCARFAERFALDRHLPFSLEPCLREIHFGVWEGREISAVWREDSATLEHYYRFPGAVTPAGGESASEARDRLASAWNGLLSRHRGEHLLLILHGGAIRLLLCHLLGAPLTSSQHFSIPHGCLTRLRVYHLEEGDFPQLILHQGVAN